MNMRESLFVAQGNKCHHHGGNKALVHTFGNFLVPVLVAVHAVNKLDLRNEDEGYESD